MILELEKNAHPFDEGIKFHWEGEIIVYTLYKLKQSSLDYWLESTLRIKDYLHNHHRTYYGLYDFSPTLFGTLTPYVRHTAKLIRDKTPEGLKGFYAVVLPNNTFGRIGLGYFERDHMQGNKNVNITRRAFFNYAEALTWVQGEVIKEQ